MSTEGDHTPGGRFGRYRLLGTLASGGMAVVYRALLDGPSGFSRPVAIKRIRPEFARDEAFRVMLLDEARLSGRLQHPNVVQVLECGEVEGELYIAMELLEGVDLRAVLVRSKQLRREVPAELVASFGAQLASALHYAHSLTGERGPLGLVHRDISPTNVMVTNQGVVKLLDFGIAKAAGMLRDQDTRTGVVKGKFAYMSPEQAGGLDLDSRSDLFALGVVLTELLTLRQPFRGENDLATLRLVREAKLPPVTSVRPGLAPEWDRVLQRLLTVDPAKRFQTGEAVERALLPLAGVTGPTVVRDYVQSLGVGQRSDAPATGSAVVAELTRHDRPTTKAPSRRVFSGLALGGAMAVVLAGGFWARRANDDVRTPALRVPPTIVEPGPTVVIAPTEPAVPATPPAEVMVSLQVQGPKGAKVVVDGQSVGSLPYRGMFKTRAQTRRVRVEKGGFVPLERLVPGDTSVLLETVLQPLPVKRSVRPPSTGEVADPFR